MLDAIRKHATGWVAKVLFAILIVSFAIWGIGDIFRGPHGGSTMAEVAGTSITQREITNEFENRWHQLQQQYGANLDRRAAVSLGLLSQAIDATIARHLVDAHGHDLDLTASDDTIAELIRQDRSFQGSGGFERERFQLFLRSAGMTEEDYVAAVRRDLVRSRLVDSLTGPVSVPEALLKKLLDYRNEQRSGRVLVVKAADMAVEAPGDEALAAYVKEHAKDYEAPERRDVTLIVLRPEDLVDRVTIPDDQVKATYDARISQYRRPEQRKVEQLLATDQATAKKAAGMVAAGQSFTAVAEALKGPGGVERSELGPLARGDLPESHGAAAWSLPAGGVSEPVQSPFGWHLLRVTQVEPEQTQPYDSVKSEIRREMALEEANRQLPDTATKLDDEIAAGTPLDAAAEKLGLTLTPLKQIDRSGHDPGKERLAADRLTTEMLESIFQAAQGETSLLTQTQDGHYYYIYRIDGVTPAHERDLAELRDEVTAAWTTAERRKRAHARAEELRTRSATSPAAMAELAAKEQGVELRTVNSLIRSDDGAAQQLSPEAVKAMFDTKPGNVAAQVVDVPAGSAILAVDEVLPAEPTAEVIEATRTALLSTLQAETLADYEAALRQRYRVSVDQKALAQLMEAQAAQ